MTTPDLGVEGAVGPSQAAKDDTRASVVADEVTACHPADSTTADVVGAEAADAGTKCRRAGGPRLTIRFEEATLAAIHTRAERLGLHSSVWVRATVRDALDSRRMNEFDAVVAAALNAVHQAAEASAEARALAAQIRPLAINVNDLDARARRGDPVTFTDDVPELIELLREVRALLGDRVSR